jgi:hypothetical protein
METAKFSDDLREEQFVKLQDAQTDVLHHTHWFEFLACLMQAGYRREELIISSMAAIYAYAFFLLGKCVYKVSQPALRKAIARWFFVSALTARYSTSPESVMEKDLAALRDVTSAQGFVDYLENQMALTLTTDYWNITLPGNMATSAARSPELAAYCAALNLLDARVLFSKVKVSELMDPGLQPRKALLDRHHLFPKAHLKKRGFITTRQTNQIANMALLEWPQNINIKDDAPASYFPRIMGTGAFTEQEQQSFAYWHALPESWETMEYEAFLPARRKLMGQVIREGFEKI